MSGIGGGIRVRLVSWQQAAEALALVRRAVFIEEQGVPEALEWDNADADALHALAVAGADVPIGCARLLSDGHIGRVAVLQAWRGRGVGQALLQAMLDTARARSIAVARLNAQVHALEFYRRSGFEVHGDVFDDAGIPHRAMVLNLTLRARVPQR